jgi:hypothetical protein
MPFFNVNVDVNQLLLTLFAWSKDRKTRRALREIKEELVDVLTDLQALQMQRRMQTPSGLGRPQV